MLMNCDACGSRTRAFSYWNIGESQEKKLLQNFIFQESGKEVSGNDFELCDNCKEKWEKFRSRWLKEEIIKELTAENSIDCQIFLKYAYQNYLIDGDYSEVKNALLENIKHYKNEWEI